MASLQDHIASFYGPFTPVGAHTTNGSLAAAVTLTVPANARRLLIQALTQNVRLTFDGTTPTASVGFRIANGTLMEFQVQAGMTLKVIQETASASIEYQYGG